jgi:UDP-2,3-diacylglucosamine pyrophosphatase LpxH
MTYLPTFGELYVVSDIHLGGRRTDQDNFQIFNHGRRLGNLVKQFANQREDEDVCLVLNGDIIDSLAEDDVHGYVALDADSAIRMMAHIFSDAAFQPVWDGLERFVGTPKRNLVFVIGNHDIELSLPIVENAIRQRLAAGNDAQSRIHFATHGGGFACQVAGARIFCTHGNELDDWNWVDFRKLGELANAINAGRAGDPAKWKPNAGTRLVVDVMNNIKRRYPFVDVLKPEVAAVASVLLALDKDIFKQVDLVDAFPVLKSKIKGGLVTNNLLSADAADFSTVSARDLAEETARQLLGPNFHKAVQHHRREGFTPSEDDLLLAAERTIRNGQSALDAVADQIEQETLGAWDLFAGWVGLVSKEEGLRRALRDWMENDRTFDVDNQDNLYQQMQKRIGSQVDFVVTGHTHKPRALRLKRGNGYYYNSGTWIRTLRLTEEVLDNQKAFEEIVWPVLTAGTMEALDQAMIPGPGGKKVPLLFDRTNVVQISAQGNSAVGQLLRVTDGISQGAVQLDPESGTKPFKVG